MTVAAERAAPAARLVAACRAAGVIVSAAESCTGGLLCAAITSVAGASEIFRQGFVTYADEAKTRALGVPPDLLAANGAVSREVAAAMADGALHRAGAGLALATTGIAGPDGGSADKPVGLVWIAAARAGAVTTARRFRFDGDRGEIRDRAVAAALAMGLEALDATGA